MQQRNQTSSRDETLSAYLESERRLHGDEALISDVKTVTRAPRRQNPSHKIPIATIVCVISVLTTMVIGFQPPIRTSAIRTFQVIASFRDISSDTDRNKRDIALLRTLTRDRNVPPGIRAAALTVYPVPANDFGAEGTLRPINPVWEGLSDLSRESPSDMALLALAVRKGTQGSFRFDRPELEAIASPPIDANGKPLPMKPLLQKTHPDAVKRMREDTARGERLDPDNMLWPMMAATVHLALHEDALAVEALKRAATKPLWREYIPEETRMHRTYANYRFGDQGYLGEVLRQNMILFPHYALLRGSSRAFVGMAITLEKQGRDRDALRIRAALRQVGMQIALESTTDIGSLVGAAVHSIATGRVRGDAPIKTKTVEGSTEADDIERERLRDEAARANVMRYMQFADTAGNPNEGRLALAEQLRLTTLKRLMNDSFDVRWDEMYGAIKNLIIRLGATVIVGLNIFWLLTFGGVAMFVIRVAGLRDGGRLAMGPALALFGVGSIAMWFVNAVVIEHVVNPGSVANEWGIFTGFSPTAGEDAEAFKRMSGSLITAACAVAGGVLPGMVCFGGLVHGLLQRRGSVSRSIAFAIRGSGMAALVMGIPVVLVLMVDTGRLDRRLYIDQTRSLSENLEQRLARYSEKRANKKSGDSPLSGISE